MLSVEGARSAQAHLPAGAAGTPGASVDPGIFRAVMRQLAGGVTVITTRNAGEFYGMTATAVCSVSADPPTILVVVNRTARTHPHIDARRGFIVNFLASDQRHVAERFAGKASDQFSGMDYEAPDERGAIFNGVAAYLQCDVSSRLDVGSHTIFIGKVVDGGASPEAPLVYHNAQYGRIVPIGS